MHFCTRNLELQVLSRIGRVIDMALNLDDALENVLEILQSTLSLKRAVITLADRNTGQSVMAASCGFSPEEMHRGVHFPDEGVINRIAQVGKSFYLDDMRSDPVFPDRAEAWNPEKGAVSFFGAPVIMRGELVGVLIADRLFGEDIPSDADSAFLAEIAALVARFVSINEQVRRREEMLLRENAGLKYRVAEESDGLCIAGRSPAIMDVRQQVAKVAPTGAAVLLLGESGTGKTLAARTIHELSERRAGPFVAMNFAEGGEGASETALFGHEKGKVADAAVFRSGLFEDACGGTVYLDDIGEMPVALQTRLLRVLQEKKLERVGGRRTIKVDVRILAATDRDLGDLVEKGVFRADLFYRLNVFPIRIPPLRERKEDVEILLNHFLFRISKRYDRRLHFTTESLNLLKRCDWPGNVREMEKLVERAALLAEDERIESSLIQPFLFPKTQAETPHCIRRKEPLLHARKSSLQDIEKNEVIGALRRNQWVQIRAARDLGITARQMGYRVIKFGLENLIASERAGIRAEKREQR